MWKNLYLLFLFISLSHISAFSTKEYAILEHEIGKNRRLLDSSNGEELLSKSKINELRSDKAIVCIDYVFQALYYSKMSSEKNRRSQELFHKSFRLASEINNPSLSLWVNLNYAGYLYHYRDMKNSLPIIVLQIV